MVRNSLLYQPAVGYLRRSTDRQEQSIGDQRRVIEAYALKQGFDLLSYYTDDAISGATSSERAAFLKLIGDAKRKDCPFKHVLVYDIKRSSRVDNDEAGCFRHQPKTRGIEIIYVSEGFNGDDTDDLLRPVKQWQARQELKDLSKVTMRGLLTRADGGWWVGGVPPYGYDLAYCTGNNEFICIVRFQSDGSRQVIDENGNVVRSVPKGDAVQFTKKDRSRLVLSSPDRVELVKQIFEWYVVDAFGFKAIAKRLNALDTPSPFGNNRVTPRSQGWCGSTVACMLKNPVYVGDMVWNRTSFGKFHRIENGAAISIRNFPGYALYRNGEEDWIVTSDSHPAIVTRTRFEESQKRRENTANFGIANTCNVGRGARSPFLLTGLIKCSHCGHSWNGYTIMNGRRKKDGSNTKNLYNVCNGFLTKGAGVCPRHLIPKEKTEKMVVDKIDEMLQVGFGTPEGLASLREKIDQVAQELTPQNGIELDQVDSRTRDIKTIINNLIDNLTSANKDFVDVRLTELKREVKVLESKQLKLVAAVAKKMEIGRVIEQEIELAKQFPAAFQQGTTEEKRLLIRAFVNRVDLDPLGGGVSVVYIVIPGLDIVMKPVNS